MQNIHPAEATLYTTCKIIKGSTKQESNRMSLTLSCNCEWQKPSALAGLRGVCTLLSSEDTRTQLNFITAAFLSLFWLPSTASKKASHDLKSELTDYAGHNTSSSMLERLHCSIAWCADADAGAMRARLTLNPKLGIVSSISRASKQSRNLVQPLKGANHLVKPDILAESMP